MGNLIFKVPQKMPDTPALKTLDDFKEMIKGDKLTVIDFTASWCPPCKAIKPLYNEFCNEIGDKANIVMVDVDNDGGISEECGIAAMPTFKFYKNGEEIPETMIGGGGQMEKIKETAA